MSISCPICHQGTEKSQRFYPFCSSRCQQIDLGQWLSDSYKINGDDSSFSSFESFSIPDAEPIDDENNQ